MCAQAAHAASLSIATQVVACQSAGSGDDAKRTAMMDLAIKRLRNELLIIQGKKALPGSTPHAVEGWTATPVESSRDVFDRTTSL